MYASDKKVQTDNVETKTIIPLQITIIIINVGLKWEKFVWICSQSMSPGKNVKEKEHIPAVGMDDFFWKQCVIFSEKFK